MTAQALEPDGGFHPIVMTLIEDSTETTCVECGPLEHTGSGMEGHVPHGAEHALVTGHMVTERRVRVTVLGGSRVYAKPGRDDG